MLTSSILLLPHIIRECKCVTGVSPRTYSFRMDFSNSEIDAQLLEQFRCLGTNDRDELVKEFNRIVGNGVPSSICQFFLDLANW